MFLGGVVYLELHIPNQDPSFQKFRIHSPVFSTLYKSQMPQGADTYRTRKVGNSLFCYRTKVLFFKLKGEFFLDFFCLCTIFNTASSVALSFHWMLRRSPGQFRLRHWLSDALTTRLDPIHHAARSHPHLIHKLG
jgi:hypothetical protein